MNDKLRIEMTDKSSNHRKEMKNVNKYKDRRLERHYSRFRERMRN